MFENVLGESIIKRARAKGLVKIEVYNLRDWTSDRHKTADDKPFGGGPGMVMKIEPVYLALKELKRGNPSAAPIRRGGGMKFSVENFRGHGPRVILLTPQGRKLDQRIAKELAREKRLILICGHYEGVDERIRELADDEISIGDYVLTCGEIPAMVLVDCVTRLIPGVLGDDESITDESFEGGLLEYPQYTRPAEYKAMKVPATLMSGDHKAIEEWRKTQAFKRTARRRPDLLAGKDKSI